MFPSALRALSEALIATAGEDLTYSSLSLGTSGTLCGVRGRSTIEVANTDGAVVQVLSHDFLISAEDLARALSSAGYAPMKGDTISTPPCDGFPAGQSFRVIDPPYSPSDHEARRLRVHTVRIT